MSDDCEHKKSGVKEGEAHTLFQINKAVSFFCEKLISLSNQTPELFSCQVAEALAKIRVFHVLFPKEWDTFTQNGLYLKVPKDLLLLSDTLIDVLYQAALSYFHLRDKERATACFWLLHFLNEHDPLFSQALSMCAQLE